MLKRTGFWLGIFFLGPLIFIFDYACSVQSDKHTSRKSSYYIMRMLYYLTRGQSQYILGAPFRIRYKSKINMKTVPLNEHGFIRIEPTASVVLLCERISSELAESELTELLTSSETGNKYQSRADAVSCRARRGARIAYSRKDVVRIPEVWILMKELQIHQIAEAYLGASPILTSVDSWIVAPIQPSSNSELYYSVAAQTFHYDMDWIRFLKVFVNLSNVGPEHGPFEFIPFTHKRKNKFYKYRRFASVEELGINAEIATGPTGSVFVADTSGLHRDGRAVSGWRHVLQFEFAISLFGAKSQYDDLVHQCKNVLPQSCISGLFDDDARLLRFFNQ